jgi:hypothetical protein
MIRAPETVLLMDAKDSLWHWFLMVTYFTTEGVFSFPFLFSSYLSFLTTLREGYNIYFVRSNLIARE